MLGVIFVVTIYECGRERAAGVLGVIFVVTIYECGRESCGCVRCYFCGDDTRVWQRELQVC